MLDLKGIEITNTTTDTTFTGFLEERNDVVKSTDYKYLYSKDANLKQGDIVLIEGESYLVIQKEKEFSKVYAKSSIRKSNYTLKIYINDTLHYIPACIDTKSMGVNSTTYFNLADGNIIASIPDTSTNRQVAMNQRVILFQSAFEITGTEWLDGIEVLNLEKTTTNSNDDLENEIADRWLHETKVVWAISIDGAISSCEENKTQQFTATVTADDVEQNDTIITWESSDPSIATIDSNGLLTGIAQGTTDITVSFDTVQFGVITATRTITIVEEVIVVEQELIIDGSVLYYGYAMTVSAKLYQDGILVDPQPVSITYTFDDTTYIEVTETNTTTIKVKGVPIDDGDGYAYKNRYVNITADDGVNTVTKQFKIERL